MFLRAVTVFATLLCALTLVACDDNPFHDPRCDTPTALDSRRGSTDVLFSAPWSANAILVSDSIVFWTSREDRSLRRTQLTTGCTITLVRLSTSLMPRGYPSGLKIDDSIRVSLDRDFFVTGATPPLSGDISTSARLIAWSGDSVGLFDPNARRTFVISTGARPSIRALRDSLRSPVVHNEELRDPRFYVAVSGRSTANPSPEEATWPTWASGVARLRERPSQRIVTSLPVKYAPRLAPGDTAGLRRMHAWNSLRSQSSTRIATTNPTRDTIYVADTLGAQRRISIPFPAVRNAIGTIAPGDSAPALLQMFLTDTTVWVVFQQRADRGAIALMLAEVDDYGRVRRCATEGLEGSLVAVGQLRMIEHLRSAPRDTILRTVARPTPPACSVNSVPDLLKLLRRQRS